MLVVVGDNIITVTRFSIKLVLTYTSIFYQYYQLRPATSLLKARIHVWCMLHTHAVPYL